MRTFYIYKITNTLDGKFYIGSTATTLEERWRKHCSKSSRCRHLYNAIKKYGRDAFVMQLLYEGFGDCGGQHKVEQTYLDNLPRNSRGHIDGSLCYNIAGRAGGGMMGGTPEEHRDLSLQGRTPEEHRDLCLQGRTPEEHRDLCLQGRTPEEHRDLSLQGRTPEEHANLSNPPGSPRASRPGTVTIDGKVFRFPSVNAAAKFFKVHTANLRETATGKRKYATSPTHGKISYVFD